MKSNKVFVFPCVNRSEKYDLKSKLLSEENITNIVKSLVDNKSFVINNDINNLEFVIDGYYFKLSEKPGDTVYATIHKEEDNFLSGDTDDDENSYFEGLVISNEPSDGCLPLLIDGSVPDTSKIKFNSSSLNIMDIDCGELN